MASKQNLSRLATSSADRLARSAREASPDSQFCATLVARCTGTLVNKDTTSKDTITMLCSRSAIKDAESKKFLTCKWDLPTKGERIVTRSLDRVYVR